MGDYGERLAVPFLPIYVPSYQTSVGDIADSLIRHVAGQDQMKLLTFVPDPAKSYGAFRVPRTWFETISPQVEYVPATWDRLVSEYGILNESFGQKITKRFDYGLVCTMNLSAGPMLQNVLSKPYVGFKPTVLHYVTTGVLGEYGAGSEPERQWLTNMSLYWNVFMSDVFMRQIASEMAKYFKPSVVKQFIDRSIGVNLGVHCKRLQQIAPVDRDDTFVLIYGGRYVSAKRVDLQLEIANELFKSGMKIRFDLFLMAAESRHEDIRASLTAAYPFVRIWFNRTMEEFWQGCAGADVFLCTCFNESYGLSYMEQAYLGVAGIYFDGGRGRCPPPWLPEGYKYVVRDRREALMAVRRLSGAPGERKALAADMRAYIDQGHDRDSHAPRVVELMTALARAVDDCKPKSWREVLNGYSR